MAAAYGKRLRTAREHAAMSQAALARRIGLKPQAVQYLEDDKNDATGSQHTASLARACGVDPVWLETGAGTMSGNLNVREPAAHYTTGRELARAAEQLPPHLHSAIATILFALEELPRSVGSREQVLQRAARRRARAA